MDESVAGGLVAGANFVDAVCLCLYRRGSFAPLARLGELFCSLLLAFCRGPFDVYHPVVVASYLGLPTRRVLQRSRFSGPFCPKYCFRSACLVAFFVQRIPDR